MQSSDDLQELINEIEASKRRLQGMFGGIESDVEGALKTAEKALKSADKHLKSIEEDYVRNDLLNSGALKNTTTSYKFFWFKAIVEIVENRRNCNDLTIEFRELFVRMLADAFRPTQVHKLSLGGQDMLANYIKAVADDFPELTNNIGMGISPVPLTLIEKFETSDRIAGVCTQLKKNVPYAFLRPFAQRLGATIQGDINGAQVQVDLCRYSEDEENYQRLPYKIDRNNEIITISPNFKKFILSYYDVINGFIKSELTTYLEKRNPLVPNISQKLDCLASDRNLTSETKIWKSFEEGGGELKDVFDLKGISFNDDDKLAIDHFIPWNFVAHNEIWNLSPMKSANNSSKSDKLLTGENNILCFINQQWSLYNYLAEGNHKKYREQYIPILQGVSDESGFKEHLGNAIKQHQEIALSRGWERLS